MKLIKSLIISFVLVTVLNIIISKDSKHLKKDIGVIHYILVYFFILYLNYTLKMTLRFDHPIFNHDINDLIMNTIGTIVGWVIFNAIRKVYRKSFIKTAINISSNDTLAIKLESCVYVVIAIMCL